MERIDEHSEHEHEQDQRVLVSLDDVRARRLATIEQQIEKLGVTFSEQWQIYKHHKQIADSIMADIELLRAERSKLYGEIIVPGIPIKSINMIQAMEIYNHIILNCIPSLEMQKEWYAKIANDIRTSF